jgi:hypothetical protein
MDLFGRDDGRSNYLTCSTEELEQNETTQTELCFMTSSLSSLSRIATSSAR